MKFTLYLMNDKGLKVLMHLCDTLGSEFILAVVGSRNPNVQNDCYEDILGICNQHEIAFIDRKDEKEVWDGSFRLAIGWRWIIPVEDNLIVIHDSLLPKYRGFSPLVNALINGERELGVTALLASEKYDCGDIVAQEKVNITYPITIHQAIQKVVPLYQNLAVSVVQMAQKKFSLVSQDDLKASYSIWRDDDDYHIDWSESAEKIIRFIDAVGYPYLGAFSWVQGDKIRVLEAIEVKDVKLEMRHCGKVLFVEDGFPVVIAGKGLVKIMKLEDVKKNSCLPLKTFRTRFK